MVLINLSFGSGRRGGEGREYTVQIAVRMCREGERRWSS